MCQALLRPWISWSPGVACQPYRSHPWSKVWYGSRLLWQSPDRFDFSANGWLVGGLVGWLGGWLVGWGVGWLVGGVVGWRSDVVVFFGGSKGNGRLWRTLDYIYIYSWWFVTNPFEKIFVKMGSSSPKRDETKKIWNHHPVELLHVGCLEKVKKPILP